MKNDRIFVKLGQGLVLAALLVLAGCASKSPAPVDARGGLRTSESAASKETYIVKPGDTIYSIAREHGMDFRELIALNGIDSPSRITPGRVLKIKPPASTSSTVAPVASTAPITSEVVQARPLGANTETLKREPKAGKEPYSDQALALAQGSAKPAETGGAEAKPEVKPEAKPGEPVLSGDEIAWIWPASGKVVSTFSEGSSKGIDISGKLGDPVIAASDGKVILANNSLRGYGNMIVIKHSNTWLTVYAHNNKMLVKEGQTVTKGQKIAEMGSSDADQVKLHFEVRRQGKPVDPLKYLPQR